MCEACWPRSIPVYGLRNNDESVIENAKHSTMRQLVAVTGWDILNARFVSAPIIILRLGDGQRRSTSVPISLKLSLSQS